MKVRIIIEVDDSGNVSISNENGNSKATMCTPKKHEIQNKKKQVTKKKRICNLCGKEYQPSGNRQKYCDDCKNANKNANRETIDDVMKEIEHRQNQPIDLSKK